jgi:hypothetical protein
VTTTDLVAELAKKSGLVWVTYAGRDHAVWHEWFGDAVCVVSGGREQSLPDIAEQRRVTVSLRSKSTRALAARVEARVDVVAPDSEHWHGVTSALRSGRLNLTDTDTAVERWAAESVVVRLVPDAPAATPDAMSDALGHTAPRLSR